MNVLVCFKDKQNHVYSGQKTCQVFRASKKYLFMFLKNYTSSGEYDFASSMWEIYDSTCHPVALHQKLQMYLRWLWSVNQSTHNWWYCHCTRSLIGETLLLVTWVHRINPWVSFPSNKQKELREFLEFKKWWKSFKCCFFQCCGLLKFH